MFNNRCTTFFSSEPLLEDGRRRSEPIRRWRRGAGDRGVPTRLSQPP